MCEAIMKVSSKNNIHRKKNEEACDEKLPEFENTKFRQLDDVLKDRDVDGIFKLDEEIIYMMKRNRQSELEKGIQHEDRDTKLAIYRSISTITEEQERDECILNFFNRIGKFRELPECIVQMYDPDQLLDNSNYDRAKINQQKYAELVEEAIEEHLVGNISDDEINAIKEMVFRDQSDEDTALTERSC
mmetsp:Transcript_30684/g.35118  ORF Transcript_30684/g.35118 Transcript_30684/m.35118 type:complete len:188 (-) Transcript_30684:9-572(-)